eukprot:2794142-Rhodomonas_salina.1
MLVACDAASEGLELQVALEMRKERSRRGSEGEQQEEEKEEEEERPVKVVASQTVTVMDTGERDVP